MQIVGKCLQNGEIWNSLPRPPCEVSLKTSRVDFKPPIPSQARQLISGEEAISADQRVRLVFALMVPFSLFVMGGCHSEDAEESTAQSSSQSASDDVQRPLKKLPSPSVEEARSFSQTVEEAFYSSNPEAWQGIVDWEAFLDLCFTGIDIDPGLEAGLRSDFLRREKTQSTFFGEVHRSLGDDSTYDLLRVHEVDGRQRALFRLIPSEGGVNYHDFILIRDQDGRPRAMDIYIYLGGETFSTTLRRVIQRIAAHENLKLRNGEAGKDREFLKVVEAYDKLNTMRKLTQRGDAREALSVYKELPARFKRDKPFLLNRYMAAIKLTDAEQAAQEIAATVDIFRNRFPNDACLEIMAIDYHIAREECQLAIQAIDRLDKAVGGDPYLHELRGDVYFQSGQIERATKQFELAIAELPQRESAYFALISIVLEQEDYPATLAGLKRIDQAIELEWDDLSENTAYAGFVESPYYAQWLEYLESKDAKP